MTSRTAPHNHIIEAMRGFSALVLSLSSLAVASAATISGTIYYGGGMPTCSQCGIGA